MEKNNRPIPSSFTVSMYGELLPTDNPMISKARLAMFYPGYNRNRTFFDKELTDKMIKRAIGTPVVGVYDVEKRDFLQHAPVNKAQTYGYIPESYNFAWEARPDDDGTMHDYACVDVHLYTGRYPEASLIIGKKHSMELDPDSITGSWKVVAGQDVFVYDDAKLSGCCVLGDDYEPCFEGSAFFSLEDRKDYTEYLKTVREGIVNFIKEAHSAQGTEKQQIEGGTTQMKMNFGWAEDDVRVALFEKLNPNFTEEKGWLIETVILNKISDDSFLTYNFEGQVSEVVNFTTNEKGEVIDYARPKFYSYYNSQEEQDAAANAQTELEKVTAEFAAYKAEQETAAATLTEQQAQFTVSLETANARIAELEASLATYVAKDAELEESLKADLIESYTNLLPETELQEITDNKANFTFNELEAKLAVSYSREMRKDTKKVPSGSFTKKDNPGDELVALLSRYKK